MLMRVVLRLTMSLLFFFTVLVMLASWMGNFVVASELLILGGEHSRIVDLTRGISVPYLNEIDVSVWSPDGKYLVALRSPEQGGQLLITDPAGNALLAPFPLDQSGQIISSPAWSPDATAIAFVYEDATGAEQLVVLSLNGEISAHPLPGDTVTAQVRWFDATQIRIARVQAEKIELLALQFPVLTETLLADWSFSGRINHPPVFAPDGDRVLLAAYTPQITNLEIYQFQPGANDILNLSNRRSHNDSLPEWSPDGSRIAYRMSGDGQQTILVMNADGSDHRILWQERSTTISNLRWSADGQRIAYVRLQPGQSALCILALTGSEPDCSFRGYAFRSVEWKPFG